MYLLYTVYDMYTVEDIAFTWRWLYSGPGQIHWMLEWAADRWEGSASGSASSPEQSSHLCTYTMKVVTNKSITCTTEGEGVQEAGWPA